MSIASEITRISGAKSTIKTKLNGINNSSNQITTETIDEYGDYIDTISTNINAAATKLESDLTNASLFSNNLIKKETGEELNLELCKEEELDNFKLLGKTEQDSTTGKNLLEPKFQTNTANGITITFTKEGMEVKGNSTSQYQYFTIFEKELPAGTYIINGISGSSYSTYTLGIAKNGTNLTYLMENNYTFTLTEAATIRLTFYPYLTNYSTPKIFKYQLENGSTVTDYEPYTGGIPSPSPTYPQEIKNVEVINIFDGEIELGGINPANGNLVDDNTRTRSKNFMKVNPNTTYTITRENGRNRWVVGYTKDKSGVIDGTINPTYKSGLINVPQGTNKGTFTTTPTTEYIKWYDNNNTDLTEKVMLSKGTKEYPYVPYNCIQIKKCNKNLLAGNSSYSNTSVDSRTSIYFQIWGGTSSTEQITMLASQIISEANRYSFTFTTTRSYTQIKLKHSGSQLDLAKILKINLKADKTYTLSLNIIGANPSVVGGFSFNEVQVEEGSTATPYVPHAEKTYNFPLSEGQKLMQDGKIEDKVVNPRRQIVLNGTESISMNTSSTTIISFTLTGYTNIINTEIPENILCNCLQAVSSGNSANSCRIASSGNIVLNFVRGFCEYSSTGLNTKLAELYNAGTPMILEIPLATPDETDYTPEQQQVYNEIISDGTYSDITYYTASGNLTPKMEINHYIDLQPKLNNTIDAVEEILNVD